MIDTVYYHYPEQIIRLTIKSPNPET